ncbi:hypothetical protein FD754_025128, partial [Muntiacus muntjak]
MRAERTSFLLVLGLLLTGICSVHCLPENVMVKDQCRRVDGHTLASSNTDFAFSLYKQLALENPNKNVIFSPLSVSIALAFLSLGARGSTLTEILEGLKFNLTEIQEKEIHRGFQHLLQTLNKPSNELQLSVGNAMFVQEELELLDKFIEDARVLYASGAFLTNFRNPEAAKRLINEYVKNKTQGKIEELFKYLSPNTVLVLVNYIYFKVQGTPRSLLQHVSSKASVLQCSAFFIDQLSHPYMTTGKTIALTRCTFVSNLLLLNESLSIWGFSKSELPLLLTL